MCDPFDPRKVYTRPAWQGMAGLGLVWFGWARHGMAWLGKAWHGTGARGNPGPVVSALRC
jgi:hypothetical protein